MMNDERIKAYLLEELTDEERERFEEDCLAEETWPDRIALCEEDLIDSYLRGELGPEERVRFENNYLTTEARQERVLSAAALLRLVDRRNEAPARAFETFAAKPTWAERLRGLWGGWGWAPRAASALVVFALLAGAVWLFALRERAPRTFASLSLTPHVTTTRDEGARPGVVKLPLGADALKISLALTHAAPAPARYRVEVLEAAGEVESLEVVEHDGRSVSVSVPAGRLRQGQYSLKVFAVKDGGAEEPLAGRYYFTVE